MSLLIQNDLEMLRGQNLTAMAGMDEAGRGALAGPVVVAAVVLDYNVPIPGLNDSKLLSAKRRNELYEQIINSAGAYHIVAIPPARIDEINILHATLTGFQYAYKTIKDWATFALVDGRDLPDGVSGKAIIKGDSRHACIAAASILAKVHRDRLMVELDLQYPEYGFFAHKGYGTAGHYKALSTFGPSPLHRKSFRLTPQKQ